jgi:uncharacterized protein (DUF2236 family)
VHATLIDTALLVYERFVGPLSPSDAERYYAETAIFAELFGVPASVLPPTLEAFRSYVAGAAATIEVSDEARRIARTIFAPTPLTPSMVWLAPVLLVAREVTAGLLPAPLRDQYGMAWGPARDRLLDAGAVASRALIPKLPRAWRAPPRVFLPPGASVV